MLEAETKLMPQSWDFSKTFSLTVTQIDPRHYLWNPRYKKCWLIKSDWNHQQSIDRLIKQSLQLLNSWSENRESEGRREYSGVLHRSFSSPSRSPPSPHKECSCRHCVQHGNYPSCSLLSHALPSSGGDLIQVSYYIYCKVGKGGCERAMVDAALQGVCVCVCLAHVPRHGKWFSVRESFYRGFTRINHKHL